MWCWQTNLNELLINMQINRMIHLRILGFITLVALFNHCSNGQNTKTKLSATEFAAKIKQLPRAPVLDVRSPREFSESHLANASNIDWNGNNFNNQIATFDKSKPVFVYCLSGVRSSNAASRMRSIGFKEVYQLNGGLLKWRSANLPETTTNTSPSTK